MLINCFISFFFYFRSGLFLSKQESIKLQRHYLTIVKKSVEELLRMSTKIIFESVKSWEKRVIYSQVLHLKTFWRRQVRMKVKGERLDQRRVQVTRKVLVRIWVIWNQCLDCHCIGVLRKKGRKTFLLPDEVLSTRSINTQERDLKHPKYIKKVTSKMRLSKHGFGATLQFGNYLFLGSTLWITVMVIGRLQGWQIRVPPAALIWVRTLLLEP